MLIYFIDEFFNFITLFYLRIATPCNECFLVKHHLIRNLISDLKAGSN